VFTVAGLPALILMLTAATGTRAAPAPDKGTWIVHEWGTFLGVQGSDGVTVGGMVDSDEALPLFVRERDLGGRSRAVAYLTKMETPVTYFYTDRPRQVQMRVEMPGGLLTHWFPDVHGFSPPLPDKQKAPASAAGSALDWGTFQVLPDTRFLPVGRLPAPDATVPHVCWVGPETTWRFARATDSALVKTTADDRELYEKFLFYRGLGTFALPLEVRSSGTDEQLHLLLRNRGSDPLQGLFAVWVENQVIRFGALGDLAGGEVREVEAVPALTARLGLEDGLPRVKEAVADALVKAGLYPKEARAMVDTWEKSYFRTNGLRILSILPRLTVDGMIPIHIKPEPEQLVRVMVGRIELLTPQTEQQIEKQVADLGSADPKAREAAASGLDHFGRLKEPVLHRIAALTKAPDVRSRAEALIAQAAPKK
jgi:hypothetical protein